MTIDLPTICVPGELVLLDWSPEEPAELFTFDDPPYSIPAAADLRLILGNALSHFIMGHQSVRIHFRGEF
jgi:hypothetical protein